MLNEDGTKEPILEEYGLDAYIYSDYRENNAIIEKLKNIKLSLVPYWIFYLLSYCLVILLIIFLKIDSWIGILLALTWGFILGNIFVESEIVVNLLSFGKYNKTKKQIKLLEVKNKLIYDKLEPFEEATADYFKNLLKQFFQNSLYRKRSGAKQFELALPQFSSMIDEVEEINRILITKHEVPLTDYVAYSWARQINHSYQKGQEKIISPSFSKIFKEINNRREPVKPIPPEVYYATPRKIDWDEVNKKRKITGLKGEEIVLAMQQDYLKSIGRKDLAEKVSHLSVERGDGLGYDILSFFDDGREKYIEVKSTKHSIESPFYLSRNELEFLKSKRDNAYVYRILITDEEKDVIPELRTYTATEVLNSDQITPIEYMIKMKTPLPN